MERLSKGKVLKWHPVERESIDPTSVFLGTFLFGDRGIAHTIAVKKVAADPNARNVSRVTFQDGESMCSGQRQGKGES